jgi:hypothetical protein
VGWGGVIIIHQTTNKQKQNMSEINKIKKSNKIKFDWYNTESQRIKCAYAIYLCAEWKPLNKRQFDSKKEFFGKMNTDAFSRGDVEDVFFTTTFFDSAVRIQALARGVLTRRKVHFALLSADPYALARIM